MTIKNYKTITIATVLNNINTFNIPIFLQFVPTACIIKYVSQSWYSNTASVDGVVLLTTSLVNNQIIYHLARSGIIDNESQQHSLDLKYKLNTGFINGNYDFTITNIAGGAPSNFGTLQLAITIEFIEEI